MLSERSPLERLRAMTASYKLTQHDRKLLANDPLVHNLAIQLERAIDEYSIEQVAAAFRAALAIWEYRAYDRTMRDAEKALADLPEGILD